MCKSYMHAVQQGMLARRFAKAMCHLHCNMLMSLPRPAACAWRQRCSKGAHTWGLVRDAALSWRMRRHHSLAVHELQRHWSRRNGVTAADGKLLHWPLTKPHHDVLRPGMLPKGLAYNRQCCPCLQPEMSRNVQKYSKEIYLRAAEAEQCKVHCTLVLPLFG